MYASNLDVNFRDSDGLNFYMGFINLYLLPSKSYHKMNI